MPMGSPVAGEVESSGLSMWIVEAMRLGRLSLALLMVADIEAPVPRWSRSGPRSAAVGSVRSKWNSSLPKVRPWKRRRRPVTRGP